MVDKHERAPFGAPLRAITPTPDMIKRLNDSAAELQQAVDDFRAEVSALWDFGERLRAFTQQLSDSEDPLDKQKLPRVVSSREEGDSIAKKLEEDLNAIKAQGQNGKL